MLNKKKAIIIGASSSIGLETIQKLINQNYFIIAFYNKNSNELINFDNNKIELHQCDLNNFNNFKIILESILENHPIIDLVLYSISDKFKYKKLFENELDLLQNHLSLQVYPLFILVKKLEPIIKTSKIKFIIILSEVVYNAPPKSLIHYTTAKYALMGFCKSLSVELSEYGCTVNMISPGLMKSKLTKDLPNKMFEIDAYKNPLKKMCTPEDVANMIIYLSSENSSHLNGTNILINGGSIMA